jgi:hypothetical protein
MTSRATRFTGTSLSLWERRYILHRRNN